MLLKKSYQINDATWNKLWTQFKAILVWFPLTFTIVAGCMWAFDENILYIPAIAILWFVPYVVIILCARVWLVRSKYTMFVIFFVIASFEIIFAMMASVCVYRFWSITGLGIQTIILFMLGIFLCKYYYIYWNKVWAKHVAYNETAALDLEHGRYDFLNHFDTSEDVIKKTNAYEYSSPVLINIAITVAPVGAAIPLVFSKTGDHITPLIIVWIISVPFSLYFLKWVIMHYYLFKKLSYYEKKIGKPIINGLLNEVGNKVNRKRISRPIVPPMRG